MMKSGCRRKAGSCLRSQTSWRGHLRTCVGIRSWPSEHVPQRSCNTIISFPVGWECRRVFKQRVLGAKWEQVRNPWSSVSPDAVTLPGVWEDGFGWTHRECLIEKNEEKRSTLPKDFPQIMLQIQYYFEGQPCVITSIAVLLREENAGILTSLVRVLRKV